MKHRHHFKKSTKSFALSQSRRAARIRRLKQAKSQFAARHALFFVIQQDC